MINIPKLIGRRWPMFVFGQLCMLVAAGAGLAFPWTVRNLFDSVLATGALRNLIVSIAALGGVLVMRDIAEYGKRRLLGGLSERIVHGLREQVYEGILSRSLAYFANGSTGDISSRASNDINSVQAGMTVVLTNIVQQVVVLATVVGMLFLIDAPMASVVCVFVPPLILLSKYLAKRSARTAERRQRVLGEIMSIVQQSVSGIEVIRSYLLEGIASQIHRDKNDSSLESSEEAVRIAAASSFWSGVLGSLFMLTVMAMGGYRAIRGALSTPDLIAFILYSEMVTSPFVQLASLVPEIAKTRTALRRIESVIDRDSDTMIVSDREPEDRNLSTGSESPYTCLTTAGTIEFDHIGFSYSETDLILNDVSGTVPRGTTTALVGPSGAGKSTLLRLIPRLYDPQDGTIRFEGRDIRSIPIAELRSAIGMVSQDPFIFDMSVADNIRCGGPDAPIEQVIDSARLASAHEFIMALPKGYDTIVGEGGSRLSGGQRQRIAIARTFLKDPPYLLLDEATSALDGVSERAVLDALDRLRSRRTTLVIAHRFETIRNADHIIVLESGAVKDAGTHKELFERCELYRELYRSSKESSRRATESPARAS